MFKHAAILVLGIQLTQVYAKITAHIPRATTAPHVHARATSITVDVDTTFQTMDGFGTSEAFGRASDIENAGAAAQKQALDLLFDATIGAGFTILRNRVGNGGTGDSIEPNAPAGGTNASAPTYVWDDDDAGQVFVTTKALAYGNLKYIYADAWGAPAFMKTNDNEGDGGYLCGVTGETCSTGDWRQAYANFLTTYVADYASIGITVTHLGFLNEPEYAASYSSMLSDGQQAADFIKILSPTLKEAGLDTLITCCDSEGWDNQKTMTAAIIAAGIEDEVGIITSHSYVTQPDGPIDTTRRVWATEYADLDGTWNTNWYSSGIMGEGFYWAQLIQNDIVNSNISAYLYWEGAEADATTNSCLISIGSTTSTASGRLWAMAQWSRYVRPGAVRVAATSGLAALTTSAFTNTDGTLSVQVLNTGSAAQPVSIAVAGAVYGSVVAWVSQQANLGEPAALVATMSGGAVSATVPGYSMTTFVLSGEGTSTSTSTSVSSQSSITSSSTTRTVPIHTSVQTEYGQCGGIGYTGPTVCATSYACSTLNAYYAQCL